MKTILATTYAVNPYKGSEDGMGWNFILQIARFNRVIAVTRQNNRPHIEKYMAENPDASYENIKFYYYDLPYWMRFWKKGGRGAMLYYWMWQRGMTSFVKDQRLAFDVVHNVNFHNDWTPTYLWKLGKPMVWGPVGHHPLIPAQYLKEYAKKAWLTDRLTWMVKQYFWRFSGALRQSKTKAAHILCMHSGVPKALKLQDKYSIIPSVATQDFGWEPNASGNAVFRLISAGRFVPLKGFDLTIRSFAAFIEQFHKEEWDRFELVLVGSGPEEGKLRQIVEELGISEQVKFIPWIDRADLLELYKTSSAFLFPSHEGAGMVVAEALSFGMPVICLDNEGPGEFIHSQCGFAVGGSDYTTTVSGLTDAMSDLYLHPAKTQLMRQSARALFEELFHWDVRGLQLQKIYADL